MARVGFVYKFWSDIDGETYVGSTWDNPNTRKTGHKYQFNRLLMNDKNVAKSLEHFNNIGWNNIKIDVLEEREYSNIDERLFCEREWIEKIKPTLNTVRRPRITEEERKESARQRMMTPEAKQRKSINDKKYRETHKERVKARKKAYAEENKERLKAKRETDEYKARRNENRRNQVHHCDICNIQVKGDSSALKQHLKSKKHIDKATQPSRLMETVL